MFINVQGVQYFYERSDFHYTSVIFGLILVQGVSNVDKKAVRTDVPDGF